MSFVSSFTKIAVTDLSRDALNAATCAFDTAVPGSEARATMETGQKRKVNARTPGVLNEDRDMDPKKRINWRNSRLP